LAETQERVDYNPLLNEVIRERASNEPTVRLFTQIVLELVGMRSRIEEQSARIDRAVLGTQGNLAAYSQGVEERLQRDFKFLLDRIEALEKHWHYPDSDPLGATDPPSFPSEAGPAPSQTAEATTEWETHQHDLLRWKAQGWKVEPVAGPTRADVEWCQTCGALSVESGNFKFPKSTS
jgi:hypothetical protein